jgi:signal peptidase I
MQKQDHRAVAAKVVGRKTEDGIWETIKVVLQAVAIAFFVRTFLYQPFNIPSSSMYPTLKVGDYIFVSKLSYGYSKYSFNFSFGGLGRTWVECCPFTFPGRQVLADAPQRGDVAVFKLPTDTKIDYVKRIIGLPGDRIQMNDGVLSINGVAVPKLRIEDYVDPRHEAGGRGDSDLVPQYEETLPNGVKYHVLDLSPNESLDTTAEYVVPANHYFMMGDNRDNSRDSRVQSLVGYVPVENFVGRADVIFFSITPDASLWQIWKWPFQIRWSRFLNLI